MHRRRPRRPRRLVRALLAAAAVRPAVALKCFVGRVHDPDLKTNDAGVAFVDTADLGPHECPTEASSCCLLFEASRCCNVEGSTYAVADGACGTAAQCSDASERAAVCASYGVGKRGECASATCAVDGCNELGVFALGVDAARRPSALFSGLAAAAVCAAAAALW